jgi:hypothetical protein
MDCTIVVPIGPGHQKLAEAALQSVMLASEDKGPFDNIHVILGDDTQGLMGRSAARNRMAAEQEGWMAIFTTGDSQMPAFNSEWLFFLDADDLMCSPKTYGESAFKVVEPYLADYDCIWGAIHEMNLEGEVSRRRQVDRITTYKAYIRTPAALSCQMGHFVRRTEFKGFNEDLDVCEDVDLYLREWKELRCIKQEKPLFLNRRGAQSWRQPAEDRRGRKAHTGREWSMRAEEMLKEARNES